MNWKKISTISIWIVGIIAILYSFFGKYLTLDPLVFVRGEGLGLLIFIISKVMELTIKFRMKKGSKNE
jgi:hypothetical protein